VGNVNSVAAVRVIIASRIGRGAAVQSHHNPTEATTTAALNPHNARSRPRKQTRSRNAMPNHASSASIPTATLHSTSYGTNRNPKECEAIYAEPNFRMKNEPGPGKLSCKMNLHERRQTSQP